MLLVAERRRHHTARGMVPIGVEILAFIQRQMLDQRLAPDPFALHARTANGLVAVLAGGMHHIERHARHIGDHDGAIGGLAFHLWRAGIGMRLGAGVALRQQLRAEFGDHIAVFGMHHGNATKLRKPLK